MVRVPACFISLLCAVRLCFSFFPTISLNGVVADASGHKPLSSAAIIIQGYAGIGGTVFQDSVFSDSLGKFHLTLLDSNRYSPSLVVEKEGFKTMSVRLPVLSAVTLNLDTVFLEPYAQTDSVTYQVSGSVTDVFDDGIRNALVTVTLSQGPAAIASLRDSTSLGGYYGVSAKRPYLVQPILAHLHVERNGFVVVDTSRSFASSSQSFIFNLVLRRSQEAVLTRARPLTRAIMSISRTVLVDGRRCDLAGPAWGGRMIVRITQDGSGRLTAQLK